MTFIFGRGYLGREKQDEESIVVCRNSIKKMSLSVRTHKYGGVGSLLREPQDK